MCCDFGYSTKEKDLERLERTRECLKDGGKRKTTKEMNAEQGCIMSVFGLPQQALALIVKAFAYCLTLYPA